MSAWWQVFKARCCSEWRGSTCGGAGVFFVRGSVELIWTLARSAVLVSAGRGGASDVGVGDACEVGSRCSHRVWGVRWFATMTGLASASLPAVGTCVFRREL